MNSNMVSQVDFLTEASITIVTFEGFYLQMNFFDMFNSITILTESLVAMFTLERLQFEMDIFDVSA